MEKESGNGAKGRYMILWKEIDERWVAHLLGISLCGKSGDAAKEMLKKKKVG